MNRIDTRFETLKKQNKKALITFITAGDPDIKTTEQLILEMEQAGADLIEIGVPFSDPVAEGPVIEAASLRALKNAVTLHDIFSMVERLRKKTDMPLLLMMYLNSLFKYGSAAFFSRCKEAGIDGVIVPDMPFEERDEIIDEARAQRLESQKSPPTAKGFYTAFLLWASQGSGLISPRILTNSFRKSTSIQPSLPLSASAFRVLNR